VLRHVLEGNGRFHITYTEDTGALARLKPFDIILLNGMLAAITPEEEQSLLAAVRAGRPLLVLHAASASFRRPPPAKPNDPVAEHGEFYRMLGGYVERHPPFGPIRVRVTAPRHPVTRGLVDFEIEDELFLFRNLQPDNEVLLETDFEGAKRPLAWARTWGDGKVLHIALGHGPKAAANPAFQQLLAQGLAWLAGLPAQTADPMERIGCTTVSFRMRFPVTRPKDYKPSEPDLDLLDVPAFFVEKLGIRNVEVWSKHFPEQTVAYAAKLRAAAAKAGARIINVQLDEPPFDLSSADAGKRRACIEATKQWMDITAACGAPSLRANTGGRPNEPFDLQTTADSFRQLAEHGAKIGVKILVENHGGHSMKAENVAAIVKAVNSPWCRSLPDFGNMPAEFTAEQRTGFLSQILPFAHLISAKGMDFDTGCRHTSYDIGACVRAAEAAGFRGIYSVELWAPKYIPPDPIRAVKTVVETIRRNLKGLDL
jgi:type 1 glutamine amidotransferase/sugar phosphate isomerase/epimerase